MSRHICFNHSTFKIIIKDKIDGNVVYCCSYRNSYSCWLIYYWYHAKFKDKINRILELFVVFIIEDINIKINCKEKYFVNFDIF